MSEAPQNFWKRCSICKKEIAFDANFYLCSVSTCKHKRTGYRFCSVPCWDGHLGFANHRESWAEEAKAPSKEQFLKEISLDTEAKGQSATAVRRIVVSPPASGGSVSAAPSMSKGNPKVDTLVVVSRVKDFIREQSEFNTSQCCVDALTKKVVDECLRGIEKAKVAGRKTVMGRDIE